LEGAIVVPTLKHSLFLSIGLAATASAAMYVLAYFLFTIHEEIGLSAGTALALAVWTFPIVFLGSLGYYLVRKARPGTR
jgi:lipopolysaccharide export LptBFGC system permease protein LptF